MSDCTAKFTITFDTTQVVDGAIMARAYLKALNRKIRKAQKRLRKLQKAQERVKRSYGHRG